MITLKTPISFIVFCLLGTLIRPVLVSAQIENSHTSLENSAPSSSQKEEKEEKKIKNENKYTCSLNDISGLTFPQGENIRAGKISSTKKRIYFVASAPHKGVFCPSSHHSCRLHAYLRPSDDVFIAHQEGDFACVMHISPTLIDKGGPFPQGWIPLSYLEFLQSTLPTQEDWIGRWETGLKNKVSSATILIGTTNKAHEFTLKADAVYNPLNDLSPTVGQLEEIVHSKGALIAIGPGYDGQLDPKEFSDRFPLEEQDCWMRIRMIGKYLVSETTSACAGLNASFDGIYYKK